MHLTTLRQKLRLELMNPRVCTQFDIAKRRAEEFRDYSNVFALLAVLEDQTLRGYEVQNELLRALVRNAQKGPYRELWGTVLLYAFLPSLIITHSTTLRGVYTPDDLESRIMAAFFEKLQCKSLVDAKSIASALRWGAHKVYFRSVREEQDRKRKELSLELRSVRRAFETENGPYFTPSEKSVREARDERIRIMLSAMRDPTVLSAEERDLMWSTRAEGRTIREYMAERGLQTGSNRTNERTFQRLKKKLQRAKQRLHVACEQRAVEQDACPPW